MREGAHVRERDAEHQAMTARGRWLRRVALASQLCLAGFSQTEQLYIGTYTNTDARSRGIYRVAFDSRTGRFDRSALAAKSVNPSFLAQHPSRPFLYAVNELADGAVSSFRINSNAALVLLGSSPTKGAAPCYLTVDRSGKWLFVANYGGGSIAVLPIRPDGTTGEARTTQLSGSGPSPRQKGPHPHQVLELPDGTILVPDLGTDTIARFHFNASDGELSPAKPFKIRLLPGTGPRHLDLSAGGKVLYVLGELANNVSVLKAGDSGENWTNIQSTTLVPSDPEGKTSAAEISLGPNGRYLYTSIRGADELLLFSIDAVTGKLSKVDAVSTGAGPRFFRIDKSGRWLLSAGQTSGTINVFAIDSRTGRLSLQPESLSVPTPVFISAAVPR